MKKVTGSGVSSILSSLSLGVVLAAVGALLLLLVQVVFFAGLVSPEMLALLGAGPWTPRLPWLISGILALLVLGALAWLKWSVVSDLLHRVGQQQRALRGLNRMFDNLEYGVFVLDASCCVDSRMSPAVQTLLGNPLRAGENFRLLIEKWLPPDEHETANLYLRLLLAGRTREKLMRDLNPMREVKFSSSRGDRYLCFEFRRLREEGGLQLLAVISDVTSRVALRRELESSRLRSDEQWDMMLRLMLEQPAGLWSFIDEVSVGLVDINDRLKSASGRIGEYRALANYMFRVAHSMKSSATALGLDFVTREASVFEDQLDMLRGQDRYSAEELEAVVASIERLFVHLDWLRRVARRYSDQSAGAGQPASLELSNHLLELAKRVAQDLKKQIEPQFRLDAISQLPSEATTQVRLILTQLVRNAIAHGIEEPEVRAAAGKPDAGQLRVELDAQSAGRYLLRVRDDGRGISAAHLREVLRDGGRSDEELAALSDQQIIMEIFKSGFSTSDEIGLHSGRGVGLDVVRSSVRTLGGRVQLKTEPGRMTEFVVEFGA